ncbi:MAG: valine--tRNA ligase, partial [Candidatus Peregrinibacteria bacterium]|nr:valine--tRNA ligase [Candidatus Peregrinibacteria bacterium]
MTELEKTYDPKLIEEKWYTFWEAGHFFEADPSSEKDPFCVMIPPPNVTGILHMGHALVDTLIDIIARYKRMKGFEVLWQPGTDHAGISTQTVVEKHLIATEGKTRKEYSRTEFLKHVWRWKERSELHIITQLKKLGCSADWSRLKFTMDPDLTLAVRKVFKQMYTSGLIYRGDYLVNWDPVTQTALADDEVEYEEYASSLWHFSYPVEGGETITIATTRPETMLGDTAVAVAPKDERYAHFIGKHVILPLTNRKIPIIEDYYVDKDFGSGAVKITPAHDPNDYEIALRHDLPMITIMTPDGKINENGGAFAGLTMREARSAIVDTMKTQGHLVKVEPHTHRVGVSYRSKAIIEPFLSKQWFVKLSSFKQTLLNAVEERKVELVPDYWEATYKHWISNLRDWCISRQLWWGHQIPIWYNKHNPEKIICFDGDGLPPEVEQNPENWEQDTDVLDTWFSSALWPFSTLGWPEKTASLEKFYPNTTLFTGHDILFFWVARMIFMGEYVMGEVPFAKAFLHGLIYGKSYWRMDQETGITYVSPEEKKTYDMGEPLPQDVETKWEKMSKSKGNVIDPLEIIDTYGTDAMRMALTSSATHARQIDLDRRRFEEYKNFANKVWNGARFVFMNLTLSAEELLEGIDRDLLTLDDQWILSKMNRTIQAISKNI